MRKRNHGLRGKLIATLTIFFALTCIMTTSSWAAKKIKIFSSNSHQFVQQLNDKKKIDRAALGSVFSLSGDEGFALVRQQTDFNGVTHKRYRQTYKGIPVWGMETLVSVSPAHKALRMTGDVVLGIAADVGALTALDPKAALERMKQAHKRKKAGVNWFFENETADSYIYIHPNGKAYLSYVVSFFADTEAGDPSRFVYVIDAKTGRLLRKFNRLSHADGTGPGGNQKIGEYYYGPDSDYPPFGVTQNGNTCSMDTTDVKTVNLNHGTSGSTAYSYNPCYENTYTPINGAYSPLNDAQFFGQVVYDMYQDWFGIPPLTFQLMMRVHYSTNYENAFWNGSSMTFGDGYTTFYPLVSLDVTAHEVSHGFTEQNSNLIYSGESGGINEAFSDMAGEAAEYYSRGSNDFMTGYDIFKSPTGALRYMYDPPLDGISIDHVDDYYSGLDVHYSSGIFNKAFYLIATTPGWNTRMAFDVFTKANQDYWVPSTDFQQGAEGVMLAAIDYAIIDNSYSCQPVVNAFAQVGISLLCPGPPTAAFTATPTTGGYPLTVQFTDTSTGATSWLWHFGDGSTSTEQSPAHTYAELVTGTYNVSLEVTNSEGSDTVTKMNYIVVNEPGLPVADFVASATDILQFDTVTFTDLTTENPKSWDWTFEGGTPATSTIQNPSVTYNTVGTYLVTLTATNPQGSGITDDYYINVAEKPYCASQGDNYSYEWIARVQTGNLDNSSGAAGYTDFTRNTESLSLLPGSTVNVALTPGFSGSTYTEYWKIWIDYNGDHDFDDAGEEVFSKYGTDTSAVSGQFTVPSDLTITTTRMRVAMKWSNPSTPCEAFSFGEVEDYTVTFSPDPPPNNPPAADFSFSTTGLKADFTDNSTDNDGTIVSWDWAFGDDNTSSEQNPSHPYASSGTYTVTLTVTDNDGDTDSVSKPVAVTAPTGTKIYVKDITLTIIKQGKNYSSSAVVTIWNTENNPVANATVPITWSGIVDGSASGVTAADGTVTFVSSKTKSKNLSFTITVGNVTHDSLPYDPSLNNETSDTIPPLQ